MDSDEDRQEGEKTGDTPFASKLGEIILMTDHNPSRKEILEAKKQQLRNLGMIK